MGERKPADVRRRKIDEATKHLERAIFLLDELDLPIAANHAQHALDLLALQSEHGS